MVSLDVISLFSVIPKDLLITSIKAKWPEISNNTDMPQEIMIKAIDLIWDSNYFTYKDKFYKQKLGTPMGGNASGDFADITMDLLIDKVKEKLKFKLHFLKKYVDDLFMAIPINEMKTVIQTFNEYNKHIQFTIEIEHEQTLPYLDMEIHRDHDGTISTKWYSKPLASGRLLGYKSIHHIQTKINSACNVINRIHSLTKPLDIPWCKGKATEILTKCDYPKALINSLIQKKHKPHHTSSRPRNVSNKIQSNHLPPQHHSQNHKNS